MAPASAPSRRRLPYGAGFWIVALAFLSTMAFAAVPTPLYLLYQERDGFPDFVITVIFTAYGVGVAASLYLAGHVSDWLGRRPVVLVSLVLQLVSAAVFLFWPEVPGLMVARFVNGAGVGMLNATATALLTELAALRGQSTARAALVATFVNMGGIGLGPLIGGFFAAWSPQPLAAPYAAFFVLFVLLALAVSLVPETVTPPAERPAYRPQRISLPAGARGAFWAAAVAAAATFSVLGLVTSLAPTFLVGTLHEDSRLLAGAVPFAVLMTAAIAQMLVTRLPLAVQISLAAALAATGLLCLALGAQLELLWLFVLGGVAAGAGVGILFRTALTTVAEIADPARKGEALAALFLVAYASFCIPVLLIGAALTVLPQRVVIVVFAAAVIVLVVGSSLRMLARLRRSG